MSTSREGLARTLGICLLGALVAVVLLAATQTRGSAQAADDFVGPGESIQKAVYVADPGDTIEVRGVHREDVIIRKNGIKLRGEDAVIEAPPKSKADSPCSRGLKHPVGICVVGDFDFDTGKVDRYIKDVSISGFTIRGFKKGLPIYLGAPRDATLTKNRVLGSGPIAMDFSVGAKILSNVVRAANGDGIGIFVGRDVTVEGNDVQGSSENALSVEGGSTVTVEGNDFTDNKRGVLVENSTGTRIVSNDITDSTVLATGIVESPGTKILSNDISRSGESGIVIFGPERANNDAKVVGNNISGGAWGMYVANTKGGFIAGNQVHDNCAGMFIEANGFTEGPVSAYEVKANTVENNTRSCRAAKFDRNFSGIGIALLGARDMEVTANHLSGNVPSGPTRISGGVVVAVNPYRKGEPKPTNNSVIGNHFGRNRPDIFWDKSGTGNRFVANLCNTSVPSRLCN